MKCRICGKRLRCVRTHGNSDEVVMRERVCDGCERMFVTSEKVITVKRVRVARLSAGVNGGHR